MNKFFAPTASPKDGAHRIRVVNSTKGPLGNLIEKTGFLKFETEEEANTAFDTLQAGGVNLVFAKEPVNNLYDITVVAVPAAVEQPAVTH